MLTRLKQATVRRVIDPVVAALPHNVKVYLAAHALRETIEDTPRDMNREELARLYLRGEGLEIGALNSPLRVPRHVKVLYVDSSTSAELGHDYPYLQCKSPDIVDDGATLASVTDCSQDFVIACHLFEHLEDPIGAVKTWLRVLKSGGILFLAIPDRRFTFDFHRPVTNLEHLIRDHEEGTAWSREGHFEEFYRAILGDGRDEDVRLLVGQHANGEGHTHYHVWTALEQVELMIALRRRYGFDFEVLCFASYGNEGTFVVQKGVRADVATAEESLAATRRVVEDVLENLKRRGGLTSQAVSPSRT